MSTTRNGSGTAPAIERSRLSNDPSATDVESVATGDKGTSCDTGLTGYAGSWEVPG